MNVTRNAVYEKLNGIEPQVSRAVLKETAAELSTLMDTMGGKREPLLAGAACRVRGHTSPCPPPLRTARDSHPIKPLKP